MKALSLLYRSPKPLSSLPVSSPPPWRCVRPTLRSRNLPFHIRIMSTNPNPGNPVNPGTHPSGQKLVNLIRGWPSPSLLPAPLLLQSAATALTDPSIYIPALQYGPDPGYGPLREELSRWLGEKYTVKPDVERICVTGGASQSIACILQGFTDPGYTRAVWVVAPMYFLAGPIFEDSGFYGTDGRLRGFGEDEEGPDVKELEKEIQKIEQQKAADEPLFKHPSPQRKIYRHIIYLVPTCANPSGVTMSLSRRHALVNLARKYDALIICDDVYDFLQWPVTTTPTTNPVPFIKPLPRLVDLDLSLGRSSHEPKDKHFGHVLSNGTFSKLIGPGVRTGWVEAAPDLAYGLSQTGSTRSGGAPSQLVAAMITQLLKSNDVDTHVSTKVQPALQRRHALILQAIQSELSQYSVSVRSEGELGDGVAGGYFVWLTLPDGMSGREVSERAREEENLVVAEGEMFEVARDERSPRFPGNLRLCFSWEEEADIVEGVRRLGRVVRRMREDIRGVKLERRIGNAGNVGEWA